jgi:homocitrate synthase
LTQALKERAEGGSMNDEEVNVFIQSWYEEKGSLIWER